MYEGNKKYTNGEITVFWYPKKCIHATTCYRELIEVFNPRKVPWVNMDGAPTREIIRVVKLCPTQALSYKYNKDLNKEHESSELPVAEQDIAEARIMKDGPLLVKGNLKLFDTEGNEIKHRSVFSICRCGSSNDIPFCDGMHRKTGFQGD